jgi:squalene-hopene/tetraprenyl-beta-curcumene cyclase
VIARLALLLALATPTALPCEALAKGAAAAPSLRAAVDRGVGYFRTAQAEDGSFSSFAGPAVTALAATSMLKNGVSPNDPVVAKALAYVEKFVQPDGGVHGGKESLYQNYETCIAIQCFQAAQEAGATKDYSEPLAGAERFVKGIQWDEDEKHGPDSTSFGGAGYGNHKRPDLSNTSFLLDALKSLGRGPDDPAVAKALVFVSRAQNLESEHNSTEHAAKVGDGGFYYTPAAGGSSQAGTTPEGGLRSYGSMTYAGLKSMIYAGVGPDDPRVVAATNWLREHYTLDENPGMGTSGLYYYFHTFAKALDAVEEDKFRDESGVEHDWRAELAAKLTAEQGPDGSWANTDPRWMEADPNLSTAYTLLALSYCR